MRDDLTHKYKFLGVDVEMFPLVGESQTRQHGCKERGRSFKTLVCLLSKGGKSLEFSVSEGDGCQIIRYISSLGR